MHYVHFMFCEAYNWQVFLLFSGDWCIRRYINYLQRRKVFINKVICFLLLPTMTFSLSPRETITHCLTDPLMSVGMSLLITTRLIRTHRTSIWLQEKSPRELRTGRTDFLMMLTLDLLARHCSLSLLSAPCDIDFWLWVVFFRSCHLTYNQIWWSLKKKLMHRWQNTIFDIDETFVAQKLANSVIFYVRKFWIVIKQRSLRSSMCS